jgi:hypothetical protein
MLYCEQINKNANIAKYVDQQEIDAIMQLN